MTLLRPLALMLLAGLLAFDSVAKPQPPVSAQRKARADAKKQAPEVEPSVSKTSAEPAEADEVERISVEELKSMIAKNEPLTIIDDRGEGSYDASETQIKGSIRITVDEIQSRLKEIPRDREIITYCT